MRRNTILVLIVIPLLLAACGGAAPAATQTAATQLPAIQPSATVEVPTDAPAATETVATEPAATEPPAASGAGTQVDVTLADNTIDSSLTTFQVGVPYTFVITNAGQRGHNFNISTPVELAGSLDAAFSSALLVVPQSQLGPGANVTVEYTFPASAAGQPLELSCLIRMHYQDGMLLGITVAN
ncbi:MAG: hypothetical protein M3R47_01945 [Chloroflexota bacterium]|nr:hypothetical protein [Chloroflexota bacterium]